MGFTAQIDANIDGFRKSIDEATAKLKKFTNNISDNSAAIGAKFTAIGQRAAVMSAAFAAAGAASFKMAADFQDSVGASEQIFKEASKDVQDWANSLPTYYGIAKGEAMTYASTMGAMLKNIGGLTEKEAAKQSQTLIQLAGDLTAMFGGSTQDAVRALTGALKGNTSMLDNYGMGVNDAAVKAKAFAMGISDGTGELDLQARQAAVLALIMEQTGAAQGQAAREADGASGSMRQFSTAVKNLSTDIGTILLPVFTPVISAISNVVKAIGSASPAVKTAIVVFGGLAAAFAPVMLGIGKLITLLPVLKVGFAALTGPVGLVIAAVGILTTSILMLHESNVKVKSTQEILAKVSSEVSKSILREKLELQNLLVIAKDENKSKEERLKAINDINKISPQYLGSLTLDKIKTNEAKKAVDNYTLSLRENVKQKYIGAKILELEGKKIDLQAENIDNASKKLNFLQSLLIGTNDNNPTTLADKLLKLTPKTIIESNNKQIKSIEKQIEVYKSLGYTATETSNEQTTAAGAAAEEIKRLLEEIERLKNSTSKNSTSKNSTSINNDTLWDKEINTAIEAYKIQKIEFSELLRDKQIDEQRYNTLSERNDISLLETKLNILKRYKQDTKDTYQELINEQIKFNNSSRGLIEKLTLPKLTTKIELGVDAANIDTKPLWESVNKAIQSEKDKLSAGFIDISNLVEGAIGDFASIIGTAIGEGDFSNFGAKILDGVGKFAQSFGALVLSAGVSALALKKLMLNPTTAIIAGAALIALGAAVSGAAKKMVNNSSANNFSGGATSNYSTSSGMGTSQFRGAYADDFNVTFKIGANELVGVLNTAEQRKKRL